MHVCTCSGLQLHTAAIRAVLSGVQGARHGQGMQHYATGECYSGSFAHNKRQGFGCMRYANGDVYEGHWQGDRRDGAGRLLDRSGDVVFEGRFIGGLREGQGCRLDLAKVQPCLLIALC